MKTWFITGISRGLGLALARAVLGAGDTVIGTARGEVAGLPESEGRLHVLHADLADERTPQRLVAAAFEATGRIDVIVNNAGYGLLGAVESSSEEELRRLFEVDVFAPIRIVRAALPRLRAQGSGHIVNITSIAGRAPGAGTALYSAAKAALEGFSASLAAELAPLGIKVTAVAPGAFRTDFLSDHSIRKSEDANEAYAATVGQSASAFDAAHGRQLGDPERGARAIIDAVRAAEPPLHLLLGSDALRRARAKLKAMVGEIDAWEERTRSTDFADGA